MTADGTVGVDNTAYELAQEASLHLANLTKVIARLQDIAAQAEPAAIPPVPSEVISERLTPRENHVLRLLLDGSSNRRIARTLEISESTVKNHLHSIFVKLEVADRTEAIAAVLKRVLGHRH